MIVDAYSMIFDTTPRPTVLPPSRIAKLSPTSIGTGKIMSHVTVALSPGIIISVPSASVTCCVVRNRVRGKLEYFAFGEPGSEITINLIERKTKCLPSPRSLSGLRSAPSPRHATNHSCLLCLSAGRWGEPSRPYCKGVYGRARERGGGNPNSS